MKVFQHRLNIFIYSFFFNHISSSHLCAMPPKTNAIGFKKWDQLDTRKNIYILIPIIRISDDDVSIRNFFTYFYPWTELWRYAFLLLLLLVVFFSSPNGMTCWIRNHSQSFAKQKERPFSSSSLKFKRNNNKNQSQSHQMHQILHTQNRIINGGILLFLLYSIACIYWKGRLCSDSSLGLGLETFGVSCRSNDVLGGAQSEV